MKSEIEQVGEQNRGKLDWVMPSFKPYMVLCLKITIPGTISFHRKRLS